MAISNQARALLIFALFLISGPLQAMNTDCVVKDIDICESAKNAVDTINATLPQTNGDVTYVKAAAKGKMIIHYYDVNFSLKEAAKSYQLSVEAFKEKQKKTTTDAICNDKDARHFMDYGISITCVYKYKDGLINQFTVSHC